MALRGVPLEKKVDMKCMQVNILKNIATMTRRLYALIMPHTRFRLNLHSTCLNVKDSLLETDAISKL